MKESWMEENSKVYDELKSIGSDCISNISKPFCMLACSLYGIALEPIHKGTIQDTMLAEKQKYILNNFQGDFERMTTSGRLASFDWIKTIETYFDLYTVSSSEEKQALEASDVPISELVSMLRRYMKYFYRAGHWGLMWDLVDAGEMCLGDVALDSIPSVSEDTLELLKIMGIEDFSDLKDIMLDGVEGVLGNVAYLASKESVHSEIKSLLGNLHF